MNEELKVIISADTSEAKKNIKEATDEIDNIKKAVKEASDEIDSFTKNLPDQGKELKDLKTKYMDVVAAQGANSDEAQALAKKIQDLSSEYYDNTIKAKELADMANSLDKGFIEAEKAAKALADEADRLAQEQKAAAEEVERLAQEQKAAAEEAKRLADEEKKAAEEVKKMKDNVQEAADVSKTFSDGFNKVTKAMTGAAIAIGGALIGMTAATEEARKNQALLETAFENAGGTAETAKDTYNDLYRVLGDDGQATEAAQHLAQLTTNQEELSQWTETCQGIYATFGDSLPIESLTEAANETANVGTVTGTLADALNWAGISEEDFQAKLDACNTEAEREKLIRETLNDTYADAAAKYEENASATLAQNEANLKLQDSMNKIGEAMAPVNAMLAELGAEVLAELTPYITEFAENHMPAVKEVLTQVAEAIGKVITWIADNWELVSTLAIIIAGISAALTVFSTVMGIVNAVMAASPVTWIVLGIVAAIAALVAIIVVVVKYWDEIKGAAVACWEKIQEVWGVVAEWFMGIFEPIVSWLDENVIQPIAQFFTGLWEGIKASLEPLIESIKNAFTQAWELIKVIWDLVSPYFTAVWENIKAIFSVVKDILSGFFSAAWEAIKVVWDVVKDYFQLCWDNIKQVFSVVKTYFEGMFKTAWEAIKFVWDTVVNYFKAIWDSIAGIFSVVKNVLTGNWKEAWEGIKGIVNTWKQYFSGVWDGIKKVFGSVKTWFSDTFKSAWEAVKNIFSNWGSFFKGLWDKITDIFSNIGEKIGGAIKGTVNKAINTVLTTATNIINGFINAINLAISVINAIPGVEISKLKKLEVPKMAEGGVVDGATLAMVGEAGAEAVMPLENNLEWLDKLAGMLNERMGGGSNRPIVLQVDGKTFAQISVDSINQLTRQTGNLPLVIA